MPRVTAGFTIAEIVLVVGIIGILVGVGLPIYIQVQTRNDIDIAAETIRQSLRRAEMLARASDGDTSWGVTVTSSQIALFQGTSYAARNASRDETFEIPSRITASGTTTFIFAKFTGLPNVSSTMQLVTPTNESRTISVNEKGTVGN